MITEKGQNQKNEFRRAWPYEETQKDDRKIKLPDNSGRDVQYQYQYQSVLLSNTNTNTNFGRNVQYQY